jgi:apolipoprotein N-acyltransferase
LTGVLGGSLWILALNVLIFRLLEARMSQLSISWRRSIAVLIWIVTPSVFSWYLGQKATKDVEENARRVTVVSVQPNFEPFYEKFEISNADQFPRFVQLAESQLDSTVDYLVFPETSFDLRNVDLWQEHPMTGALKSFINRYPRLHLILGVDAFRIYEKNATSRPKGIPLSVREFNNQDGTFTLFESYNAATQITSGSDSMPLYKKSKLVPGPENLPYGRFLSWLKPLFKKFGGTVGGLGTQEKRAVFSSKNADNRIAPVICYESVYGEFCGGYVRDAAAEALFVVTNDGWWDNTPGYGQHALFASLRAIELRRSVVRSANMGHSCFIDPLGRITQATPYGKAAAVRSDIVLSHKQTFYSRMGDVIGRIAGWLALGFLVIWLLGLLKLIR